jgi:hypothetical protein
LKRTAKLSTTNAPPKVARSSPRSVDTATSAAITPRSPTGIEPHFRWAGRKRSTTSTSMIVPPRISSGRIAW